MSTSERIVQNTLLAAWGRVSMALLLPTIGLLGLWLTASFASKSEVATLKERTVVLETNQLRGRSDQDNFQQDTTATLAELLRVVNAGNERVARLEARLEAQQRELDRR